MAGIGAAGAAIASAAGTFLTSTSAVFVVARLVTAVAVSALIARNAAGYDPGMQARDITVRGTVEPQKKIYGTALVSGPIAWNDVSGEDGRYLWAVICLAGHNCTAIRDIRLDDTVIADAAINGGAAAGGAVTTGEFGPQDGKDVARIYKYLGTSTQASDVSLTAEFAGWTTAHRLRGITYIVCRWNLWNRSEKVWNGSDPTNIRALVDGAPLYDPRKDSTNGGTGTHRYTDPATWEWSENPALAAADYLIDSTFGMGIDPTRIVWSAVIQAADFCEVLVAIPGGTEKRYTCNGAISGTAKHRDNLRSILTSMNGEITVSAGMWTIRAAQYTASTESYTADDVIRPIGIAAAGDPDERINTLAAQFIDKDDQYKVVESPPVFTTTLRNRDNGQILESELELPMTDSFYMAQRIQWVALHIAAQEKAVSTTMNLKAATTAVGERIDLSIAELSWSPKIFRMMNWELADDGGEEIGVAVELREDSANAYDDPLVSNYTTRSAAGAITFGDPGIAAPSGLTAIGLPGGVLLDWNNPAEFDTYTDAVLYASPDSAWSNAEKIWQGRADRFLHELAPGLTRFYWVRILDEGIESTRDPDSDTSTISATSPEVENVNLIPFGYSDFETLAIADLYQGAGNESVLSMSENQAFLGTRSLKIVAPAATMTGSDELRIGPSTSKFPLSLPPNRRWFLAAEYYPENADARTMRLTWALISGTGSGGNAAAPAFELADHAAAQGQWNQLAVELDTTGADAHTEFILQLQWTNFGDATPTAAPVLYLDTLMLFDMTNRGDVAPDVPDV